MESTLRSLKQESYIEGWNDAREAIAKEIEIGLRCFCEIHFQDQPFCIRCKAAAIARGQK